MAAFEQRFRLRLLGAGLLLQGKSRVIRDIMCGNPIGPWTPAEMLAADEMLQDELETHSHSLLRSLRREFHYVGLIAPLN